jgi:hypothetical protein
VLFLLSSLKQAEHDLKRLPITRELTLSLLAIISMSIMPCQGTEPVLSGFLVITAFRYCHFEKNAIGVAGASRTLRQWQQPLLALAARLLVGARAISTSAANETGA